MPDALQWSIMMENTRIHNILLQILYHLRLLLTVGEDDIEVEEENIEERKTSLNPPEVAEETTAGAEVETGIETETETEITITTMAAEEVDDVVEVEVEAEVEVGLQKINF